MTDYEDLLVGAGLTSLKGMTGVEFLSTDPELDPWGGFLVEGPIRVQNEVIDGMPGVVADPNPVVDVYDFTIGPFVVKGDTRPEFLANLSAVRALFAAVNVPLTRRLEAATTPFYVDDSCNGQYVGLTLVGTPRRTEADVVLTLRNLDGEWS